MRKLASLCTAVCARLRLPVFTLTGTAERKLPIAWPDMERLGGRSRLASWAGMVLPSAEGMTMTLEYLAEPYEFIDRPLWFHRAGLSQTATGYGSKLTSARCVKLPDGRIRRVYITQWSNSGTAWINLDGKRLIVR